MSSLLYCYVFLIFSTTGSRRRGACFKKAAKEYDYKGENYVVYPIKVNQMQPVVEEIISHGRKFNLGLEAGSKPELHAVIAMQCQSDSIIICNGYKDESYIEPRFACPEDGKTDIHCRGEDERVGNHCS